MLKLKFSKSFTIALRRSYVPESLPGSLFIADSTLTEDGKEMQLDTEKLSVKDIMEEVDRHSRLLKRQADLSGN